MIVQVFPEHEKAGNRVLAPMLLPCVLASALSKEQRGFHINYVAEGEIYGNRLAVSPIRA